MSVLFRNDIGWFISHLAHLQSAYGRDLNDLELKNVEKLFDISTPFAKTIETTPKKKRKRKGGDIDNHEPTSVEEGLTLPHPQCDNDSTESTVVVVLRMGECEPLKQLYAIQNIEYVRKKSEEFLEKLKTAEIFQISSGSVYERSNVEAQRVAKAIYRLYISPKCNFNGGNCNANNIMTKCHQNLCIFPPKCRFFNGDIREMDYDLLEQEGKFNAILMDPPWWNKYIRRKRKKCTVESYDMLYNEELLKFPMNRFLDEAGLVLIWCTNAPSHILELSKVLLPAWNLEHVATWYWLKVTKSGEPVCSFSEPCQKQPFERIIIASRSQDLKTKFGTLDKRLILSVPSGIHSHKPPLADILNDLLPENSRYLEIFARYLLPGWTSIGNEVLRLQCSPNFDCQSPEFNPP